MLTRTNEFIIEPLRIRSSREHRSHQGAITDRRRGRHKDSYASSEATEHNHITKRKSEHCMDGWRIFKEDPYRCPGCFARFVPVLQKGRQTRQIADRQFGSEIVAFQLQCGSHPVDVPVYL